MWVIRIPKHLPKRPVYAHDKAWQRIKDSLVELTPERLNAILDEPLFTGSDWSAEIVLYFARYNFVQNKKVSIFMLPKHKNDAYNKIYR